MSGCAAKVEAIPVYSCIVTSAKQNSVTDNDTTCVLKSC